MPIVAPVLIGAAIGAATALVTGGNVGKGALFGAIGGGISGAFGAGAQAISGAGEVAGNTAATAGSVGADAAATTAGSMADSMVGATVQEGAIQTAGAAAGEVVPTAINNTALNVPAGEVAQGFGVTDVANVAGSSPSPFNAGAGAFDAAGVGPAGSPSAAAGGMGPGGIINGAMSADASLWSKTMEWARLNPKLAAGILQTGGSMVGGIGKGMGDYMTAGRKAELERENQQKLMTYYRDFIQGNTSVGGGGGVNLGVSAPQAAKPLTRISGGNVYGGGGIINNAMA